MIELRGVSRVFRVADQDVWALRSVSLRVAPGEFVAIMGPSGSGKSTLLNVLGLLDRPSAGVYELAGSPVSALSDRQQAETRRDKIGFVFQFFHLVPRLTAQQNVELPMVLAGVSPAERRQRASDLLTSFGLADRLHHRPEQLSGGQRQRVAIARAMILEPALILADEPTGNLDRNSGKEILAVLAEVNAAGKTLLIVTHDPEIGGRASRQIRIVDGNIAADTGHEAGDART
ncbi:MAG: ABC transporter ATP-binding protein [Candidatus Schekmanbacteria bacterium]|nr:ABC transporter ATP-binding protein [Candidatus Schekmanbacteria bacterium]